MKDYADKSYLSPQRRPEPKLLQPDWRYFRADSHYDASVFRDRMKAYAERERAKQ